MWSNCSRTRRSLAFAWIGIAVALAAAGQAMIAHPALGQASQPTPVPRGTPVSRTGVTQQPPPVGAIVAEDPLTSGGMVPTGSCPSGRVSAETVGEGVIFKVRGPCTGESKVASAVTGIPGLRIPDGELRFDLKFVGGVDRASLSIVMRSSDGPTRRLGYSFGIGPRSASAGFVLTDAGPRFLYWGEQPRDVSWSEWNSIAIRLQGEGMWLLVNDVPQISVTNGIYGDGGVVLSMSRSGDLNDDAETSAIFRNMRISAIEGGDPSRAPVYDAPQRPSGPTSSGPDPNAKCDHGVPKWEQQPDGRWMLWCDQTDWTQQ